MRAPSTVERINIIQFLTGIGVMAGFTYIPLYLRDLGASNEEVAFVAAGFAILLFFSSIIVYPPAKDVAAIFASLIKKPG